jgi:hypothetical protein
VNNWRKGSIRKVPEKCLVDLFPNEVASDAKREGYCPKVEFFQPNGFSG